MRVVVIDTETHRIGPGKIIPPLVCAAFADDDGVRLYSTSDPELEQTLAELLDDQEALLVFHNSSFDVPVLQKAFPHHASKWWQACEDGRVSCTMLREMLLNLSTTGRLSEIEMPDGSTKNIEYGLGNLVLHYLDKDISDSKKGEEAWRTNFQLLEGLKASQYPSDAAQYAKDDADYTLQIYKLQDARVRSQSSYSSLSTHTFQAAVSVALTWITERGMATDPEEFAKMQAFLEEELSDDKLMPLYNSGILRRPVPPLPYAKKEGLARTMVGEWLDIPPDDVDWERLDEGLRQALVDSGIKFKKPEKATKNAKALKSYVLGLQISNMTQRPLSECVSKSEEDLQEEAKELGLRYKKTDTGNICADKVVVEELAGHDEVMKAYQHREKLQKLVTTELPRMTWDGQLSPSVHFSFKTLVETSRTSSSASDKYPSANGQNVDPRARPIFVPRPGYVFCSCDYSTLELVCVAQTTYDLFGESVHRDKINAGYDLHAYLGTTLALNLSEEVRELIVQGGGDPTDVESSYRVFISWKPESHEHHKVFKFWRKLAKPVGLGLPGGLGAATLISTAIKEPYFVDIQAQAVERFEKYPDEFQVNRVMLYHAKKLHRMTEETFRWTPQLKGIALATRLKEIWLQTYPEMVLYFKWIKGQIDEFNPVLLMKNNDEEDPEEFREVDGLCYTTPMGMHRAKATFTSAANGRAMQSPAAEGFKCAIFNLVRACVDPASTSVLAGGNAFVVDEIHDEMIVELREDIAHVLALEVKSIMESSMSSVITDVKVKAEPCLMRRWHKLAEPVYNQEGFLVPWEPKEAA